MRRVSFALLLAAVMHGGCGSSTEERRAGSEPLPSSETSPLPPPPPESSSGPMFAGVSHEFQRGERPRGGIIGRAFDAVLREQQAGPQRIESPEAAGERISEELMRSEPARDNQTEEDACEEAWNHRPSSRRRGDLREFLRACRALPEAQQRCMSRAYLEQHADECAELHERAGRQAAEAVGFDPARPGTFRRP